MAPDLDNTDFNDFFSENTSHFDEIFIIRSKISKVKQNLSC